MLREFRGFPPGLFAFFEALETDNTKEFWTAHRSQWEQEIRDPMRAMLDSLEEEFGQMRLFRPNRDVRFSRDKSPYRLGIGATSESRAVGGIGYYIEVSATRMVTGFGAMALARDQLERFRAGIGSEYSGQDFEDLHRELAAAGVPLSPGAEDPLKNVPRGFPSDHPRAEFLRWKGAALVADFDKAAWMHTYQALERVRSVWRTATPLKVWLDTHVGASEIPAR